MAHILKARVAETSTSTGTGDFTLSGAVTAHKTFASRMSVADTTEYVIYAVDGSGVPTGEWEEGTGTYSAANTLTRTTVVESSNADGAVDFGAGSKVVIMTPLSSRVAAILKGGASGEMLVKNGSADFAWAWVTAPTGTNTGDQDLSGYSLTSHNHTGTYDPAGTASSAVAAHAGTGGTAHANAVASGAAGFMTGADKAKLDGVAAGAQVNPASTDALTEGSTNLYHTAARVRAAILTGLSTATATVVTATHTVLEALGFLQKQVSDNTTAIAGKQATLVSATNIKTINGNTLLGSGDLTVSGGGGTPGGSTTQVQYNNAGAFGGDAGLTYDSTNKALSVGGATVTTSAPVVNVAQTWNNAGVAFTGKLNNFTNTASAAGSLIEDWQIGSASYLALDKSGKILLKANGLSSAGAGLYVAGATTTGIGMDTGGNPTIFVHVSGSERLRWTSSNTRFYKLALSAAGDMGNDAVALWGTAAGQVEINNGTTGTYRDIKLRNHIGTGANVTGMAAKTADYTLTLNDHAATFDASGAARTATLPALSTVNPGQEYIVIKIDSSANALTLDGNAAETINGAANISTTTQWSALRVKANADKSAWVTF